MKSGRAHCRGTVGQRSQEGEGVSHGDSEKNIQVWVIMFKGPETTGTKGPENGVYLKVYDMICDLHTEGT